MGRPLSVAWLQPGHFVPRTVELVRFAGLPEFVQLLFLKRRWDKDEMYSYQQGVSVSYGWR